MHTLLPSPTLDLSTAALASRPREPWGTTTNEAIRHVASHSASPSIQARLLGTHIKEGFTVTASEGAAADTQVVIGELKAVQAALGAAWIGQALIDVPLTALPSKSRQTATAVASNPVHTLAAIKAVGAPGTVINVLFTKQAPSARWARTLEMVHEVDAGASVLAWLVLALIHFILTVDTLITWNTLPGEKDIENEGSGLRWLRLSPS